MSSQVFLFYSLLSFCFLSYYAQDHFFLLLKNSEYFSSVSVCVCSFAHDVLQNLTIPNNIMFANKLALEKLWVGQLIHLTIWSAWWIYRTHSIHFGVVFLLMVTNGLGVRVYVWMDACVRIFKHFTTLFSICGLKEVLSRYDPVNSLLILTCFFF